MRDFSTPRTFIFSADRRGFSQEVTATRRDQCRQTLQNAGIPFREGTGSFEGAIEICFIVTGAFAQAEVFSIAASFDQDTALVVAEHDRTAYLVPVHGSAEKQREATWEHLGQFRCAGDTAPEGDYTRVGDLYFNVEPTDGPDLKGGI